MMRAKMTVEAIERFVNCERLRFKCVTGGKPYGPNGENEDNTFSRFTPNGMSELTVTNPELLGQFSPGDTFYVTFDRVPAEPLDEPLRKAD